MSGNQTTNVNIYNIYESTLRTVYIATFVFVISVVVVGNGVICTTIATNRRLWNYTNVMLFNYGIATTLRVLTAGLFNFLSAIRKHRDWPFGFSFCQFSQSMGVVAVLVSAFSLCCMSYARYRIICYPLATPPNLVHCFVSILLIWLISFGVAIPYLIHVDISLFIIDRSTNATLTFCIQRWDSNAIAYYFLAVSIVALIIPLLWITYFNIRMGFSLRSKNSIPGRKRNSSDLLKQSMKKMLAIIVIVFFVTYFPYMILLNLINFKIIVPSGANINEYVAQLYQIRLVVLVLGQITYTCSAFNVLICYRFNPHFRRAFTAFLCGICNSDAGRRLKSTISVSSTHGRSRRKSSYFNTRGTKAKSFATQGRDESTPF